MELAGLILSLSVAIAAMPYSLNGSGTERFGALNLV